MYIFFGLTWLWANLFPNLLQLGMCATVQNQPQGALFIVLNDENDGPQEIWVQQVRGSNQNLTLQRIHHNCLNPRVARREYLAVAPHYSVIVQSTRKPLLAR